MDLHTQGRQASGDSGHLGMLWDRKQTQQRTKTTQRQEIYSPNKGRVQRRKSKRRKQGDGVGKVLGDLLGQSSLLSRAAGRCPLRFSKAAL